MRRLSDAEMWIELIAWLWPVMSLTSSLFEKRGVFITEMIEF